MIYSIILSKKLTMKKIINNPLGYSLIGLIISSIVVNFVILGLSSYMSTGARMENKNYSDLNRQTLLNEMLYILRNPRTCKENLKNLSVSNSATTVPVLNLVSDTGGGSLTYSEAFKAGDIYGGKWKIESLTLENFQGQSKGADQAVGFIEFKVEMSPTSNNYYQLNVTESIPLKISVQTTSTPWTIENCYSNIETTDNMDICNALSGTMDSFGRCMDTSFPDGITTQRIYSLHLANAIGDSNSTHFILRNLTTGPMNVKEKFKAENILTVNGDVSLAIDWGSISAPTLSTNKMIVPDNAGIIKLCYESEIQSNGTTFSGTLDKTANCLGPNQYIQSIDLSTWTATCGTKESP